MAKAGDDRADYDSDPEEGKCLLGLRRREAASDDEEEDRSLSESENLPAPRRVTIHSDDDSDGQGAAADYDEELDEGFVEEEEDEVYEDVYDQEPEDFVQESVGSKKGVEIDARKVDDIDEGLQMQKNYGGEEEEVGEEGKKVHEPFAVPTAGAFYMHDDRFRDNFGGRNRRTLGGRKLWESRDDQKWGHDKYEEMNVHDRSHGHGRRFGRGGFRGRGGRNRIPDREPIRRAASSRPINNGDTQNESTKGVKGRGPRKYENSMRNMRQAPSFTNKYPLKAPEKAANASFSKTAQSSSKLEIGTAPPVKHSSLSSSSPPFYPSNKDINATEKKEVRAATKALPTHEEQSNVSRGKKPVDSPTLEKLNINDTNVKYASAASSFIGQGRGNGVSGQMGYPSYSTANHSSSVSRANAKQPKAEGSMASYESAEGDNDTGKAKSPVVSKPKGTIQSGRGSFVYGGNGADQTFPTFLPMMQFGAQHSGGIPAVGMAFPGYVGQPQLGIGSSEMTWLPVLTGAAGALGATYCPPYLSVDNAYHARASSQLPSSSSSSKEDPVNKFNTESKSYIRNEHANDDPGSRQKPRRYSETDYKQPSTST